jgi:MerR family redox-sensitive transcriptional activator SoxR
MHAEPDFKSSRMSIGELARVSGVAVSTIRYYESIGLVPEPERVAGRRRYDAAAARRLALIASGKRAGLALTEIRELLEAEPLGDELRPLARRKLSETRELIEVARLRERWLEAATHCRCRELDDCELFESLGG